MLYVRYGAKGCSCVQSLKYRYHVTVAISSHPVYLGLFICILCIPSIQFNKYCASAMCIEVRREASVTRGYKVSAGERYTGY